MTTTDDTTTDDTTPPAPSEFGGVDQDYELPPAPDVSRETPASPYADLAGPAQSVVAAAGTPLAELAEETPAEESGQKLERLVAHVSLEDGQRWEVVTGNRDFVAWDLVRSKKKWPMAADAPFLLNTFLAYAASRRTGRYAGTFEAFEAAVAEVKLTKGEPARPTQ